MSDVFALRTRHFNLEGRLRAGIECSFLAEGHQERAAKYRHIHLDDIADFADRFENQLIASRTSAGATRGRRFATSRGGVCRTRCRSA